MIKIKVIIFLISMISIFDPSHANNSALTISSQSNHFDSKKAISIFGKNALLIRIQGDNFEKIDFEINRKKDSRNLYENATYTNIGFYLFDGKTVKNSGKFDLASKFEWDSNKKEFITRKFHISAQNKNDGKYYYFMMDEIFFGFNPEYHDRFKESISAKIRSPNALFVNKIYGMHKKEFHEYYSSNKKEIDATSLIGLELLPEEYLYMQGYSPSRSNVPGIIDKVKKKASIEREKSEEFTERKNAKIAYNKKIKKEKLEAELKEFEKGNVSTSRLENLFHKWYSRNIVRGGSLFKALTGLPPLVTEVRCDEKWCHYFNGLGRYRWFIVKNSGCKVISQEVNRCEISLSMEMDTDIPSQMTGLIKMYNNSLMAQYVMNAVFFVKNDGEKLSIFGDVELSD